MCLIGGKSTLQWLLSRNGTRSFQWCFFVSCLHVKFQVQQHTGGTLEKKGVYLMDSRVLLLLSSRHLEFFHCWNPAAHRLFSNHFMQNVIFRVSNYCSTQWPAVPSGRQFVLGCWEALQWSAARESPSVNDFWLLKVNFVCVAPQQFLHPSVDHGRALCFKLWRVIQRHISCVTHALSPHLGSQSTIILIPPLLIAL